MNRILTKPDNFEEMVEYAAILSKPFPHARVDFYDTEDTPVVGEVTLGYPSSDIEPMDFNLELGQKMVIPKKDLVRSSLFRK